MGAFDDWIGSESATAAPAGVPRITVTPNDRPASALDPRSRDMVVRTVLGEAAQEPEDGQAAVAAVIRNRLESGKWGDNPARVVTAPNQFEPWNSAEGRIRMRSYSPDSPAYQQAAAQVDRAFGADRYDPTNGATHFVAPQAQAALGRQMPSWAQGEGQPIGRHVFYAPEGRATDFSAQSRQSGRGAFDDWLAPQGQVAAPPVSGPPSVLAGGEPAPRVAREGMSEPAPMPPGFADKLAAMWENPPKDRLSLIGMIKSAWEGATLPGDVASGKVSITGEDGRTNPEVIQRSAQFAAATPLSSAPGGLLASNAPRIVPTPPAALEANVAARNIGVDLPKAIASDSSLTRFMGQVANKMPGGGPMQDRIGGAIKQTGDAVANAVEKAGGAADPMAAGQGFKTGIEESFKPTIKSRISEAYDEVGKHIDPEFTRPLVSTQRAIDDIVARRSASGEADPGKAVKTVIGGATRSGPTESKTILSGDGFHIADDVATAGGLTYQGVKDLRTRVGEMLDTGVFPEGMSQGELRRIYGTLSDDLKATVAEAGGPKASAAFSRANAMNKFAEEWKDNLGKVLGSDRSGEGITTAILRMASNGSTGDLKALTMARAAVPKSAWQDVAATAVSNLGKDRKGDFSPAIFLNDFAKLSDRGKTLLFKDVGSGDVLPHLNDIATVSKKFVEAGKLANTSGTAGHTAAFTTLGSGAVGLLAGSLVEPMTAIGLVVGNNILARSLSRPASAAAVARWSRAYETLARKPEPRSLAAFNIAGRNLANTVNGLFGAKIQPADFVKAIQAPVTGRAEDQQ